MLKEAGFSCCDFSLDTYLRNYDLYQGRLNSFFDRSVEELHEYFTPHKDAAWAADIEISQIHMSYPNYVPGESDELNNYLMNVVAPKSMELPYAWKIFIQDWGIISLRGRVAMQRRQ